MTLLCITNGDTEKLNREFDNLTSLDARNSLLLISGDQSMAGYLMGPHKGGKYEPVSTVHVRSDSDETLHLGSSASSNGYYRNPSRHSHGVPLLSDRQPTVPTVNSTGSYGARHIV